MKLIVLILFLFAAQAQAEEEKKFSFGGSLRIRAESDQFTDYSTLRDYSTIRARGDLTFKPSERLRVFFQPQFSKYFGQMDGSQSTSGTNFDDSMTLHQGYFAYKVSDDFEVLAGRSILSYGDELVVGPNDWNYIGRSFDLFKLRWTYGLGWTDVFASKINDTSTTTSSSGDNDFFGLYNSWTTDSFAKNIDLYAFYSRDARNGIPLDLDLWTAGLRLKSILDLFDYRAEGNVQTGTITQVATTGGQIDAEVGYKISPVRVAVEGFSSSDKYNQLYPTGHKWLGYADVLSRRNLTGGGLHLSTPLENWKFELGYEIYSRTTTAQPVYKFNGTTALGSASASSSLDVGSEADLTVKYKVDDNFSVQSGMSYFQPGNYLKDQSLTMTPVFYYLQAEANF